jgi:D-alanyl-D-alanine carboxypeptidase (penicillin-binding protein 5/6)
MKYTLTILLSVLFVMPVYAGAIETSAKQAIVIDFETGQILFEKNADEKTPTSSMSKVITAYAIMAEIKAGDLSLQDEFFVSEKAWRKGGSKMFVELGKKISVEDLLKGVIIQSGNDATIVLAEGVAGTEEKFAEHLTNVAKKLGMNNSNFVNASGWPDEGHYSTARDLSILARHTITDFPDFYSLYSQREFTYNDITQQNRNPLFGLDIGADGIKTGHTEVAGYGLMASAKSEKTNRRVIVVFNGTESKKSRAEEAEKLVTWGLNSFKNKTLIDVKKDTYRIPVLFGEQAHVQAGVKQGLTMTVPKLGDDGMTSEFKPLQNLEAPVKTGDVIGAVNIMKDGKSFKTIEVVAKSSVAELGAIKKMIAKAKHKFKNRKE